MREGKKCLYNLEKNQLKEANQCLLQNSRKAKLKSLSTYEDVEKQG